jgi:hypothetical protein
MSQEDAVLKALKERYFILVPRENIGHTPELTKEIEHLEKTIRATEDIIASKKKKAKQ